MNRYTKICAILAQTPNRGIGYKGRLPWEHYGIHLTQDMKLFNMLTRSTPDTRKAVVMGYNTWKSLPVYTLPNRTNYVISKQHETNNLTFNDIHECIQHACATKHDEIWFIGGSHIYKYLFDWNVVDEIWLTTVFRDFPCDVFAPPIPNNYKMERDTKFDLSPVSLRNPSPEADKYLNLNAEEPSIPLMFQHYIRKPRTDISYIANDQTT